MESTEKKPCCCCSAEEPAADTVSPADVPDAVPSCCRHKDRSPEEYKALVKAEENSLILCAGQGAYEDDAKADTQALADVLKAQGLPAHLELWGGDVSHDWYWWGKMWNLFAPRILEK